MSLPHRRGFAVLAAGAALGILVQLMQLRRACADPISEACVWGKAYLPISLALAAIYGLALSAFAYVLAGALRRRRAANRAGDG